MKEKTKRKKDKENETKKDGKRRNLKEKTDSE